MDRFSAAVVKHRKIILIVCVLLLIPSVFGMLAVIFILPAFLKLFDGLIIKTTGGLRGAFQSKKVRREEVIEA